MAPFYAEMCDELGQQVDKSLLSDLKQKNKDKLAELDKKIADAEELEGQFLQFKDMDLDLDHFLNLEQLIPAGFTVAKGSIF